MDELTKYTYKLYVYLDVMGGCYRWILRSLGGETIARSTECYKYKDECLSAAELLRERYSGTTLRDLTVWAP